MQRLSFLLAAPVLCAVLLVSGCGDNKQPNPAASAPPPAVTVVKVTAAEIKPATTFTGRIEARNKVDLRARVDGFLEKRLFAEGADVAESELLFVIENGLYQAAVDQAKAALETAESTLKLADLDVDRQTQLFQRNVTAQATLEQATAKQGEARGNMLAQKAALEKAELQLSYTDIKSPISGRIGRASVSLGNFVSPSNSALVVPQQALQVDQTGPYVLVVDKDNKIQIRRVETDAARGVNIVIRKGLAADELIVTEGIQRVRPGQVVAPTEAKPGA
jgi:membrane fusion protein (multidrug efflux system)